MLKGLEKLEGEMIGHSSIGGGTCQKKKIRKNVNQNKSKMKLHLKSLFERYMSLQFKINKAQNIYFKVLKSVLN
jgi:hypothetical protein